MSSKGLYKSAASVKANSNVIAQEIYPKEGVTSTVGFKLSKKEAARLGRNLLMLAADDEVSGHVIVTGHKKQKRVGVLGRKRKKK